MARQPDPTEPQATEQPNPVGEQPAQTEQTDSNTEGEGEEKEKVRATVPISVPTEFHKILTEAAEKEGITVAALARNRLAASFNYTLPPMTRNRAKTYATPEERKAAAAQAQRERYQTANALLAAIKAGELGNIDLNALVAKYAKPKDEPKAETEPAAAPA